MAAIAHNPAFAKKVGVPQSVGQDFNKADKGRKFSKGGDTMAKMSMKAFEGSAKDLSQDKKLAKKHNMSFNDWENSAMDEKHDKQQNMNGLKRGGGVKKMATGGAVGSYRSAADGIAQRGKTRGQQFCMGGKVR